MMRALCCFGCLLCIVQGFQYHDWLYFAIAVSFMWQAVRWKD